MDKHYWYLNLALAFWAFALGSWCIDARLWALVAASLTLLGFFLHFVQHQVNAMFGKEKTPKTPPLQPIAASLINEKEALRDEKQNTVVASGTNFVGNITSNGQVHIYGTLTGNIEAKDNIIRIMRNGVVEGNLSCRELFIDGTVNGECSSETLNIEENGNINGTLTYSALTIKKGGTFSGQAKLTAPIAKLSVEKEKKRAAE
ncbi:MULTISPECIES: bactofilin family protein [Kosakonia]|uniref:bactofilin family protein n=1 Tax=Kosakonia TaxID=1330547 RepID=UPI001907CB95|nr:MULTISPECIES: polymer-forming cytoskeletal protein [Kosakonia]MBK0081511.1 polymer-forming cytoskeletal protein [Kosakonia sp. S57]MBK0087721.1 polymer-forming cytoskeletal protein [Kosakonia sp. S58]MDT3414135.1 cytoskeletal protein CcmA (bactofilin family) [Atlantibacter sp. SORGH_AS_0304]WKW42667.1 polymer-forming cytoskeletal protein [Kosakonia cowanii]